MPTGYTHNVGEGKLTEFPAFAMQCARAFGAMISMRDDPADAPIPDSFEASDYYGDRIVERQAELDRLRTMSPAEIAAAAAEALEDARATHEGYIAERRQTRARYEAMLAKVLEWEPPTPDHIGLKDFMSDQLRQSIDFDCSEKYLTPPHPAEYTPAKWHERAAAEAARSLAYSISSQADERRRAEERTAWVKALRASLAPDAEPSRPVNDLSDDREALASAGIEEEP